MPAMAAPMKDEPTRIDPAALSVGVGLALDLAVEIAEPADLEAELAFLELADEAAVTMPVGAAAVEGATTIPPAAVTAVGAAVVEADSDLSEPATSVPWMMV